MIEKNLIKVLVVLFVLAIGNLVFVKIFNVAPIELDESIIDLIDSFSIPFITGCFVYFLTSYLPKRRLNKRRVHLVHEELNYSIEKIERRLAWLNLIGVDSKELFKTKLSEISYDDIVNKKPSKTAYQCLIEIKNLVEDCHKVCLPYLLFTENQVLIEKFKKATLRPSFLQANRRFITNEIYQLQGEKIDVGKDLFNLYTSLNDLKAILKT